MDAKITNSNENKANPGNYSTQGFTGDPIKRQTSQINNLKKDQYDLHQKYIELQNKIEEQEEEICSNLIELENVKCENEKKLASKEQEILRLSKLLESYSISFGSDDPSEIKYFEVLGKSLYENMFSSDSLYCASRKGENYKYTINSDGPVKRACDNVERDLEPFCEIVSRVEGANDINQVGVGIAKYNGSELEIIEKVKISLIKQ